MKRYLILGLVFLMVGCKTIGEVNPPQPTNIKTGVKKVPLPQKPKAEKPEINALTTAKPILCANQKEVFQHLMKLGEIPLASWSDADYGFLVILFMNTKTGGSSVIEVHGLKEGAFKNMVCFISTGVGATVNLPKEDQGTKAKLFNKKGIDFLRPVWYKYNTIR